jgi:hypothetical protein
MLRIPHCLDNRLTDGGKARLSLILENEKNFRYVSLSFFPYSSVCDIRRISTIDTAFKLIGCTSTRQLTTKRFKLAWRERLKIALYYFCIGVNLVTMAMATVAVRHAKL